MEISLGYVMQKSDSFEIPNQKSLLYFTSVAEMFSCLLLLNDRWNTPCYSKCLLTQLKKSP